MSERDGVIQDGRRRIEPVVRAVEWFETFLVVEPQPDPRTGYGEFPRRQFPVDMLRYSICLPLDEVDSRAIAESFDGIGRDRRVVLRRFSTDGEVSMAPDGIEEHSRTSVKRWRAFGWDVVCHVATREEAEAFREYGDWPTGSTP